MTTKVTDHRGSDGRRLDGKALATQVANELNGLTVAQAFAQSRAAGFRLCIVRLDGERRTPYVDARGPTLFASVTRGLVGSSWVS